MTKKSPIFLPPDKAGGYFQSFKQRENYQDAFLVAEGKDAVKGKEIHKAYEDVQRILTHAPEFSDKESGTTAILVYVNKGYLVCAELGDSSAYLMADDGKMIQPTKLHSHTVHRTEVLRQLGENSWNKFSAFIKRTQPRPASSQIDSRFDRSNSTAPSIGASVELSKIPEGQELILLITTDGAFNRGNANIIKQLDTVLNTENTQILCNRLAQIRKEPDFNKKAKYVFESAAGQSDDDVTGLLIKLSRANNAPLVGIACDGHGEGGKNLAEFVSMFLGHRLGKLPEGFNGWEQDGEKWLFNAQNPVIWKRVEKYLEELKLVKGRDFTSQYMEVRIDIKKLKKAELPTLDKLFAEELKKPSPFKKPQAQER